MNLVLDIELGTGLPNSCRPECMQVNLFTRSLLKLSVYEHNSCQATCRNLIDSDPSYPIGNSHSR